MKKINIAIDGPSAAGKSTLAKHLSAKLHYIHLDTGAMYRCCAWKAKQLHLDLDDQTQLVAMLEDTEIVMTPDGFVYLDGINVTEDIRQHDISMLASNISKHPKVRADLVRRQQEMAKQKGYILDGRDIGSVVLPDAELKIYQTASVEIRAYRRHQENLGRGMDSDLMQIEEDIRQRDHQDKNRASSPLIQVPDAILLDTTNMSMEEAVAIILKQVENRLG